jgi:hypothetical protein
MLVAQTENEYFSEKCNFGTVLWVEMIRCTTIKKAWKAQPGGYVLDISLLLVSTAQAKESKPS